MLLSVTFKKNYRCFPEGWTASFCPGLNLLVGDQGSGKSSLLSLLSDLRKNSPAFKDAEATLDYKTKGPMASTHIDFEKQNPRVSSRFDDSSNGAFMFGVASMFSSHGQTVKAMIRGLDDVTISEKAGRLVTLDEPDASLSPRTIYKVFETFERAVARGVQLIVSAHNPILIELAKEVFSMEHGAWMPSMDFLEACRSGTYEPPSFKDEKDGKK